MLYPTLQTTASASDVVSASDVALSITSCNSDNQDNQALQALQAPDEQSPKWLPQEEPYVCERFDHETAFLEMPPSPDYFREDEFQDYQAFKVMEELQTTEENDTEKNTNVCATPRSSPVTLTQASPRTPTPLHVGVQKSIAKRMRTRRRMRASLAGLQRQPSDFHDSDNQEEEQRLYPSLWSDNEEDTDDDDTPFTFIL